jgi:RHS repeat-associated protein
LPPDLLYVHPDHLGSPQKLTDASQATVWDGVFDPFGEQVAVTGLAAMQMRFPGQYADEETGFSYNYFRDYEPNLGRYVQSDPIGLNGGLNRFGYAEANPIRNSDEYGLSVIGKVIGSIVELCLKDGAVKPVGERLTREELVRSAKEGKDVIADSRNAAKDVAKKAQDGKEPMHNDAHKKKAGPKAKSHYHLEGQKESCLLRDRSRFDRNSLGERMRMHESQRGGSDRLGKSPQSG